MRAIEPRNRQCHQGRDLPSGRSRNSTSSSLTFSACSCCTQWPAPSIRWQPIIYVQALAFEGGVLELSGVLGGALSLASNSAIRAISTVICAVCASI